MTQIGDILNEKLSADILMYVAAQGHAVRTIDLYNAVSNNPRMPIKLGKLEDRGLITRRPDPDSTSILIEPTPVGYGVGVALEAIEKMLMGDD